jgi:hypothetical protein
MNNTDPAFRVIVTWADIRCEVRTQEAIVLMLEDKTIKLALREELMPMQRCTIALADADGTQRDSVPATIHHVWRRDKYVHVTCELAEPLSEGSVELLVRSRQYDRRSADRRSVTINARARPELCTEAIPIRIVDLSAGGCCLHSPIAFPTGHRVELLSWDESGHVGAIVLRVKWQRPSDEGFILGCRFAKASGYASFLSLTAEQPAGGEDIPSPRSPLARAFYLVHAGMSLFCGASA